VAERIGVIDESDVARCQSPNLSAGQIKREGRSPLDYRVRSKEFAKERFPPLLRYGANRELGENDSPYAPVVFKPDPALLILITDRPNITGRLIAWRNPITSERPASKSLARVTSIEPRS
jgi:hypothetical protein